MARDDGFDVQDLIACYRQGVFPMADARGDARIFLIDPERRGILPLERFHIPRRLARTVRANSFAVKVDTAFEAVVEQCAAERAERPETWINRPIQQLYCELYKTGVAHSVECWEDGRLVGGISLNNVRRGIAQMGSVGYWSSVTARRQGNTLAAVRVLAEFAFGPLGLHRLEAACVPTNEASKNLLLKAGFRQEGLAAAYLKINGEWRDHLTFGLLASEFRASGVRG